MTSVPNSDSEQYTESELGWVHQVHTLNPACAHEQRALCRIVAHMRPCRGPLPIVSQESPTLLLRACARWCAVSQRCIVALLHYLTTQLPPLSHDTMLCSRAGRVVACIVALLWLYRKPCCAPARPCRGPQATPRLASQPFLSQYKPLYRDPKLEDGQ